MTDHFRKAFYLIAVACFSAFAAPTDDLFQAVQQDNGAAIGRLVAQGVDPNARRADGQTALILALRDESPKVLQALLAQPKLDVNQLNGHGESPLMLAALRGNLAAAESLLARGAKAHKDGWSPLHYAATGPEPQITRLLLARGAPVDALSPNRTTPLMMAARYGDERHVELLLAAGAQRSARNDKELTAADFARTASRDKLADRLKP
jgi:uncharacterized protein